MKRSAHLHYLVAAAVLLCANSIAAVAWGTIGHETIVAIAERHLSPQAKKNIGKYISYDLVKDARWMDRHRSDPQLLYAYHFHEQCINLETLEYDPNAQVQYGDATRALCLAKYNMSHRSHLSDSVVVLNIRMALHFIGDLHCPVHIGIPGIWFPKPPYRQDVGKWYFRGTAYQSFHKLIDLAPGLIYPGMDAFEIAEKIDKVSKGQARKWVKGDFIDWTNDSAKRGYRIYEHFPPLWEIPDTPQAKFIPDDFLDKTKDILTEELLKAGYQLAFLLNQCFDN